MSNSELRLYLERYMFVGLCETWVESENILYLDKLKSWLSGYSCFVKGGMRVSKYGRCSGEIVLYVKNDVIANGCYKEVAKYCKFGIFLLFDNSFMNTERYILVCCAYVKPENSNIYKSLDEKNGVEILENTLLELKAEYDDPYVILMGDLNSRTGDLHDYVINDEVDFLPVEMYDSDKFSISRQAKDTVTNTFGYSLIDLCKHLSIHILNGRSENDSNGEFTFYANETCSTIDYALMSSELFKYEYNFSVKRLDKRCYDSDHLPLELSLNCFKDKIISEAPSGEACETTAYTRILWNDNYKQEYLDTLNTREVCFMFDEFNELLKNSDTEEALKKLECTLFHAAKSMTVENIGTKSKQKSGVPWWDAELTAIKQRKNRELRLFRKFRSDSYLQSYLKQKKMFKMSYRTKEQNYKKENGEVLANCKTNSREFWNKLKMLRTQGRRQNESTINPSEWFDHFEKLLNIPVEIYRSKSIYY